MLTTRPVGAQKKKAAHHPQKKPNVADTEQMKPEAQKRETGVAKTAAEQPPGEANAGHPPQSHLLRQLATIARQHWASLHHNG